MSNTLSKFSSEYDSKFVGLRLDEEEANALLQVFARERPKSPERLTPVARVVLRISAALVTPPGECMVCGFTDAKGEPQVALSGPISHWVNRSKTLCTTCVD